MRVLVAGSGAREHALAWVFSTSRRLGGLFVAPGNAGTADIAVNLPEIDPTDFEAVVDACREHRIDVVVVGPEAPLAAGLVDHLGEQGIQAVGPNRKAAALEASKAFSKDFMIRNNIPTAAATKAATRAELESALGSVSGRVVLKEDGLAAGKGVLTSDDPQELLAFGVTALEHGPVLVEEFLEGYELSVFVLMDGKNHVMLPPCADFKKAHEGETGPNTGGMGSICPVPWADSRLLNQVESRAVLPTMRALKSEGLSYRGVLYFGLMITSQGPKVLEYNVRFGDPETQVLLPLIRSDFCNVVDAIVSGTLLKLPLRVRSASAAGIVVASPGYPEDHPTNLVVDPLPSLPEDENLIFHAGTHRGPDGTLLTGGGRCFTVVGLAEDMLRAREAAYGAVDSVRFEGAWYRTDIGQKLFME